MIWKLSLTTMTQKSLNSSQPVKTQVKKVSLMDEDFNHLVMECNNCHLQFYASELRTDAASDSLMCVNCLTSPGSKLQVIKDRALKPKKVSAPVLQVPQAAAVRQQVDDGYTAYECTACSYAFRRKTGFTGLCPYCNKKTVRTRRN